MRRTIKRYSEAFKLKVVREIEEGKFKTQREARSYYGITGCSTITSWLRKYGKEHLIPRKVRIETMEERDIIKELRSKIKLMEKIVTDLKIDNLLYQSYFEILCEDKGIEDVEGYKKKLESKVLKELSS